MKMEPIVSSETSAIRTQTPGNYPKRNKLHLEHGESLKTRMIPRLLMKFPAFYGTRGGSFPHSEEPTNSSCPEPDKSTQCSQSHAWRKNFEITTAN